MDLRHIHKGRCVWSLAQTSLNVKVKGQRSRSPGTKSDIFGPIGGLRAVLQFMFDKASLVSSFFSKRVTHPSVVCLYVCLSCVTLVHPTHLVEILSSFSMPFGTLAIRNSRPKRTPPPGETQRG